MFRRITILLVLMAPFCMTAQDNPSERVKLSGQVMLSSATNSNLTGGYFSLSPAARGQVTASYSGFAFTAMRNSDFLNPASLGNLVAFVPAYSRTFGKFAMTLSLETYLFDQRHDLDLIVSGLSLGRKGAVNVELLLLYGACYAGEGIFIQRLAFSKEYEGYTFRLSGWNTQWFTHRMAFAAEISKKLSDRFRLTIIGNLNHIYDTDTTQKFGVVRIGYLF